MSSAQMALGAVDNSYRMDTCFASIQSELVAIYALVDPRTSTVRYVGKAQDPEARFRQHLQPAQLEALSRKNSWLKGLLAAGERPELQVIDWVPAEHANEAERFHIWAHRELGHPLTNGTDGGDGGAITDPAALARIRAAHVGRKASAETRAKMSASHKARQSTPEARERQRQGALKRGAKPPVRAGEANNKSYLSDAQVREIRERSANGEQGAALAREFDTTAATVSNLVTGKVRISAGGPIRSARPKRKRGSNPRSFNKE